MSIWLVIRAWMELLYIDLVSLRGFQALRRSIGHRAGTASIQADERVPLIVKAMERAIVLYGKPVLCLQHSIAVTRLLRRHGVDAEVVIGCRLVPFFAHAWVEVAGDVVAQKRGGLEHITVLDRW